MSLDLARTRRQKLAAGLLGLIVVLAAVALSIHSDVREARAEFYALSDEIDITVTRRLDNLNAALRSLSGMHHAMTRLSQQELSAFAQDIDRSYP